MTQSDKRALSRAARDSAAHIAVARDSCQATKVHIRDSKTAIHLSLGLLRETAPD